MITREQVASASAADLLVAWNALTGKNTTKFASLEKGRAQVAAAFDRAEAHKAAAAVFAAQGPIVQAPKAAPAPSPMEAMARTVVAAAAKKTAEAAAPKGKAAAKAASAEGFARWKAEGTCPFCAGSASDITAAGLENTVAGQDRSFCHGCSTEWWNETGRVFNRRQPGRDAQARSAAIKDSWADEATRAARSVKDKVFVTEPKGTEAVQYRSVKEAFAKLGLPLVKHIAFRGGLKKAGSAEFNGYKFEIRRAA